MESIRIINGLVYLNGSFQKTDILCCQEKIASFGNLGDRDDRCVDADGMMVIPGFMDIHTHGAAHVDVNAADAEDLQTMEAFLASQGTTSFHASILTDTQTVTEKCLSVIQKAMTVPGKGARLMGAHLEGPFLSMRYKGAMPGSLLRDADLPLLRKWMTCYPGVIRYLTVSPEVPGAIEMIRDVSNEIVVSIGHSEATYDQAMQAIDAGARCVTHVFNAMRPFHHHDPAILGAALESDCWCEAICDGKHLAPETVRILLKCKGYDRVVGISDSIMAAGLPDGPYKLGVNDVTVRDGEATLTETGVRAGSVLTGIQALRNLMAFTGNPIEKVLPILTSNPAEAMRMGTKTGRIAKDMAADLVILDRNYDVQMTLVGGKIVYQR